MKHAVFAAQTVPMLPTMYYPYVGILKEYGFADELQVCTYDGLASYEHNNKDLLLVIHSIDDAKLFPYWTGDIAVIDATGGLVVHREDGVVYHYKLTCTADLVPATLGEVNVEYVLGVNVGTTFAKARWEHIFNAAGLTRVAEGASTLEELGYSLVLSGTNVIGLTQGEYRFILGK